MKLLTRESPARRASLPSPRRAPKPHAIARDEVAALRPHTPGRDARDDQRGSPAARTSALERATRWLVQRARSVSRRVGPRPALFIPALPAGGPLERSARSLPARVASRDARLRPQRSVGDAGDARSRRGREDELFSAA